MKILHASDLHYSAANLVEADRCFGFAVETAIQQKVDLAIVSGDSTDHELSGHSPALRALAKRLKQLADHCPVLLLQGTERELVVQASHRYAVLVERAVDSTVADQDGRHAAAAQRCVGRAE